MTDASLVAEFKFVVNKSFLPTGAIPIPHRLVSTLRDGGVGESSSAVANLRGQSLPATIRSGWRAGGKYYQIRVRWGKSFDIAEAPRVDSTLAVRVKKVADEWHVDLT